MVVTSKSVGEPHEVFNDSTTSSRVKRTGPSDFGVSRMIAVERRLPIGMPGTTPGSSNRLKAGNRRDRLMKSRGPKPDSRRASAGDKSPAGTIPFG